MIVRFLNATLISGLIISVFIVARAMAITKRDEEQESKAFWARESEANMVRRKDISGLNYITIALDKLPIDALINAGLNTLANDINAFASKKTLNLSEYTNTDLKMLYGPANLPELTECDDNYTVLIRLLDKAGRSLTDDEKGIINEDAAKEFYAYAIEIGSDITSTYEGLARIYKNAGEESKLRELKKTAEGLSGLSKKTIVAKLKNI